MMKPTLTRLLTGSMTAAILSMAALPGSYAQEERSTAKDAPAASVDPGALSILKRAVDHLAGAKYFSTTAEIWQDLVQEDGSKLQFTKYVDIRLRRPDRLRIDVRTTTPKRSFYYDGKSLTFHDPQNEFYGVVAAPDTIDAMIDKVEETLGVEFPLEDILISKPFGDGASGAKSGKYLGLDPVLGKACHHLAFQAETISWQVWIEEGSVPALRKAVITFDDEVGSPQFTALFNTWEMRTELPDYVFSYEPLGGATKIEFEKLEASK